MNLLNIHNEQLERDVIGALIIENNAILSVIDFFDPTHFYSAKNQIIYRAIIEIYTNGGSIDYNSICAKVGFENVTYLIECTKRVASSTELENWAKQTIDFFVKREIAKNAGKTIEMLKAGADIADIIEFSENNLFKLKNLGNETDGIRLNEAADRSLEENQAGIKFVKTGFLDIDEKLNISRNDLVILAARPSFGKTALALNLADSMNDAGLNGLFFSLEMKATKLVNRIISAKGNIPHDWFQRKMSNSEIKEVSKVELSDNLIIYDKSGIKTSYIRAKAKEMQIKTGGIDYIFIDYIQLITATDKNKPREQQVSQISRELKSIAMDLKRPFTLMLSMTHVVGKSHA